MAPSHDRAAAASTTRLVRGLVVIAVLVGSTALVADVVSSALTPSQLKTVTERAHDVVGDSYTHRTAPAPAPHDVSGHFAVTHARTHSLARSTLKRRLTEAHTRTHTHAHTHARTRTHTHTRVDGGGLSSPAWSVSLHQHSIGER